MKRVYKSLFRAFGVVFTTSALLLAGCSDFAEPTPKPEPEPEPGPGTDEPKMVVLNASIETTRTLMNETGDVLWVNNDQIRVFGNTAYADFTMTSGSNSTVATFEGYLPEVIDESYVAGYPVTMWEDASTLVTPEQQRYRQGSFANNTNPMLSTFKQGDSNITFRNLMGILKFQLTGTGTIDNIVISNNDVQLTGEFAVNSTTLALTAVNGAKSLSLVGVDVTLGAEPEGFYVLVPPATYRNLTITVNCSDGTSVVREAQLDVTIARNEVLPLAPISIDAEPEKPLVTGVVNEERSSWNKVSFDVTRSEECFDAYVGWAYTSDYEAILEQNVDWTIIDLFNNWMSATNLTEDTCDIVIQPNMEYTFVFLGFDADGNYDTEEVRFTQVAEFGDNVGVRIDITNVTAHTADYTYTFTGDVKCFYDEIYWGDLYEHFTADTQSIFELLYGYNSYEITSDSHTFPLSGLTAYQTYTVVIIVEGVDGSLAYEVVTFTTVAYEYSNVTMDVIDLERGDTWITAELGGDWTSYRYTWYKNPSFDSNSIDTQSFEAILAGDGFANKTDRVLELKHENADTFYVVMILPYDADGNYGNLVAFDVRTDNPYIRESSTAYRSYLGTWSMSFSDSQGQLYENYAEVIIEQEYEGSSYIVRGLGLGHAIDDSLRAYFIDDKLCLIAGEQIEYPAPDFGSGALVIVNNEGYFREYGYLAATLNEDTLTFDSSIADSDIMCICYKDYYGNTLGYYPPLMVNSTWTKLSGIADAGATTENFTLGEAVDAGWK